MPPERETKRPPITDSVADRLRSIRDSGGFEMPSPEEHPGYRGTGGSGRWLEHLLGIDGGNRDRPDSDAWELKSGSGAALITLFHLEHSSGLTIGEIIDLYGYSTDSGKVCFRHTIRGDQWSTGPRVSGFRVQVGDMWTIVHRENGIVVEWSSDNIINALSHKLRRLIYVRLERQQRSSFVFCHHASLWWEPRVSKLFQMVENGQLRVDFDACRKTNGSIRNHGTKFRLHPLALGSLYARLEVFD